jgi:hypothetical protein
MFLGDGGAPYCGSNPTCTRRIATDAPGEGVQLCPSPNGTFAFRGKFSATPLQAFCLPFLPYLMLLDV